MCRTLFFVTALLLAVGPVFAEEGKKLTNAELKEMTAKSFFYGGKSLAFGSRYVISMFRNGTREVLWTNGVSSNIGKGKWRIDGDRMCVSLENNFSELCSEWRKSGDRIEIWRHGSMQGYFYLLP